MTVSDTPGKSNLSTGLIVFLADLDKNGFVYKFTHILSTVVDLVLVAERAVLGDMDAL
jgi:hypothetical protein